MTPKQKPEGFIERLCAPSLEQASPQKSRAIFLALLPAGLKGGTSSL